MIRRIRKRTHEILESTRPSDPVAKGVQWFIITLILLNVGAVIVSTVERLDEHLLGWFRGFEVFSVIVFSVEYLLRLWASIESDEYDHPVWGRLRYAVTPGALIDLAAILPFYLPKFTSIDLRAIRALRLFRLFRLLKLGRYSRTITLLSDVLREKKAELILALSAVLVVLVFASSLMYFAEHNAQPDKFGSIPETLWWGVITLTTVGYGDVYPVTTLGKLLGGVISLLGIGLFALPAGILSNGFHEAVQRKHGDVDEDDGEDDDEEADVEIPEGAAYCPCCGQRLAAEEAGAEA
ncbi:MAG: ion transporter [Rhodothermales bacterium]|nr:ion transporter [Rhodothermales bacterium]